MRDYYIHIGGCGGAYPTIYSALKMIDRWLDEGEVSGTDHYIGEQYDTKEYLNLILIRQILNNLIERK